MSKKLRARPGFEPGTSRTLSENHTPRPTSQHYHWKWCFIIYTELARSQDKHHTLVGVFAQSSWSNSSKIKRNTLCFRPGSNRGPCACEAHVITTTLRKPSIHNAVFARQYSTERRAQPLGAMVGTKIMWSSGAMDNASAYGAEDCRFESCLDRKVFLPHYIFWDRLSLATPARYL